MLEGRVGDGLGDRRIGQRIDRRFGFARLARAGQDGADVGRQRRGTAVDANASPGPASSAWMSPAAKFSTAWPTCLAAISDPPRSATSK